MTGNLALHLLSGLINMHGHRQGLAAAAETGAAYGSGAKIVEAHGDAHVGVGRADSVGRVEADPAQVLDVNFRSRAGSTSTRATTRGSWCSPSSCSGSWGRDSWCSRTRRAA